ncbi:MAG: hypothetical protein M3N23_00800, partial [Pseudomonadota bacterium]|nr:hypothetical protein [Pseudomonadota bacterium]
WYALAGKLNERIPFPNLQPLFLALLTFLIRRGEAATRSCRNREKVGISRQFVINLQTFLGTFASAGGFDQI